MNGHNAISFSGVGSCYFLTEPVNTSYVPSMSVLVVINPNSYPAYGASANIFGNTPDGFGSGWGITIGKNSSNSPIYTITNPGNSINIPCSVSQSWMLLSSQLSYVSNTSYMTVFASGSTTSSSYFQANQTMYMNGIYMGYSSFNGQIAEVILCTNSQSIAEQQQLEGYLAWKYGIQNVLPPTHPYYSYSPLISNIQSWKGASGNTLSYINNNGQFIGTSSYALTASYLLNTPDILQIQVFM